MNENEKSYLKKSIWVVLMLFVIRCIIEQPSTIYEIISFAGEAIAVGLVIMTIYEKWLWKWNPLEKIPKIYGEYTGNLEYENKNQYQKKSIKIIIKQSILKVSIKLFTNEITSNSILSNFVWENGEYVLYYTYITNPKSKYSMDNPVQYGTCRMTIREKGVLSGYYWTTRKTKGDIIFKKIKSKK